MQLQNHLYTVEVEPAHGLITGIRDRAGDFEILAEPRLADNFRLLIPLPRVHSNYIHGPEQKLTAIKKHAGGLRLYWKGPLRNAHGQFDVDVALRIEFVGAAIHFRCKVVNRTAFKIAEIWCPVLGGLRGLGPASKAAGTKALIPIKYAQSHLDLFRKFGVDGGLGIPEVERVYPYPCDMSMAWTSLYHPAAGRGLYFAAHDPEPRTKMLRFALHPGCAVMRKDTDWPTGRETGGAPVGLKLNWAFFPYLRPGNTFQGPPIVLQSHAGDWRQAARLYRQWFERAFGVMSNAGRRIRRELVTLDTMFLLPEDNINYTFADIPRWAKTAADRGCKSVLISGWQVGGHDRGYPDYSPDPRLGTWAGLRKGVAACHKLGLNVLFFVNVQPVDMSTPWYRRELKKYVATNPWQIPTAISGWGMGTLGARIGATHIPVTFLNPAHRRVRSIFIRAMRKLAAIGADGVHIDKYSAAPMLDFNPRLKSGPDIAQHKAILETTAKMLAVCRRINPRFDFSYESWFDRLMQYSDVTWWWPGPVHSVLKEVFPEWVSHAPLMQPAAYNVANACVLKAHAMLVAPGNCTQGMDYQPMQALLKYVAELARIRADLFDYVSTGEILDASDRALFLGRPRIRCRGSFAASPDAEWTLFRHRTSGGLCAVLGNLGRRNLVAAKVSIAGMRADHCRVIVPFAAPKTLKMPLTVTIPPERVVFIVEQVSAAKA